MHKGQVMTPYYRILNRHGGFTWIQSCATVVCNSKNGDEQSIVCVNYVLRYQQCFYRDVSSLVSLDRRIIFDSYYLM